MPRIDKIVEPMSQGNHDEAVLLSDSPLRLKSAGGEEELSISLTHRQITSMVEEILPSALFTDLVMMKPVEFTYRHPAGVLDIKVVPGDTLWRVIIKAPQGLDPFRTSKSRRAVPEEKFQLEDSENALFIHQEDDVVDKEVINSEIGGAGAVDAGAVDEEISNEVIPDDKVVDEEISNEVIPDNKVVDEEISNEVIPDDKVVDEDVVDEDVVDEKAVGEKVAVKNAGAEENMDEEVLDKEGINEVAVDEEDVDKIVEKEDSADEDVLDKGAVGEKAVGENIVGEKVAEEAEEDVLGEARNSKEKEFSERVSTKTTPVPAPESKPSPEHRFRESARGLTLEVTSECDELIERAKIAKSGTLLLIPGQRPWVYGPQGYTPMAGARSPVTDELFCELLEKNEATAKCAKTRHSLRAIYGERKESSYIRCTLTQNRGRTTAAFRIPLADPSHPSHIGLPPHTSELLSGGGVLLVASPSGGGRTTTAFVIGSALMSSGHQLGLCIGRPIERKLIVSAPNFSFDMSHKEIPRGVMLAQDLGASVVVLDDGPPTSIERALRLAEMGIAVVFTIQGDNAVGALTRSLGHIKKWKRQIPRLSRLLKGVIYQELIWTKESNRSPVFERLLPDNSLLEAIAREQWDLLGGKRGGSVTSPSFAESLKALAEKGVIDRHTASKHSDKKGEGF